MNIHQYLFIPTFCDECIKTPTVLGSHRKSSNIWTEVTKIEGECKCKYCGNIISRKVERITYLNKCCARKNQQKIAVSQNKRLDNFEKKSVSCSQSEIPELNLRNELASSSSASNVQRRKNNGL